MASSSIRTVQIKLSDPLLEQVDVCAKQLHQSRAEFMRQACQHFIGLVSVEQLDQIYTQGYQRHSEDLTWAEMGASMTGEVFREE